MNKGFTKFDNEMLEAILKADLNATEIKVMLMIVRYSCGYQRDNCDLAIKFIADRCNKSKSIVAKAVKSLKDKNFISKSKGKKGVVNYAVNHTHLLQHTGVINDTEGVSNITPYKDNNIYINNIYKKQSNFCVPTPKATKFSEGMPKSNFDYEAFDKLSLQRKIAKISCKST